MVAGAVNPALLGYDLRRGCVNVFADHFDTLIDKRSRCRPLLHGSFQAPVKTAVTVALGFIFFAPSS